MSQRKLTVTSCEVKYEGTSKKSGNPFTLYEVAVLGEDGEPVMENFKAFDMLPIGQLVEYQVEREDHPEYGTSFMLKLPPGVKAAAKPNYRADIDELRQRVARLESEVGSLTGSPSSSAPAASPALAGMGNAEDIPF